METITVQTVMIDWLTVTSNLELKYLHWKKKQGRGHKQKRMQYEGKVNERGVFVGSGTQNDERHYMTQSSGEFATEWAARILPAGVSNCTRLDIQVTIEYDEPHNSSATKDVLKFAGIPMSVSSISSDTGDTTYIGSRTSERMMRIYQKGKGLIRFEWEFKGGVAAQYWQFLHDNKEHLFSAMAAVWVAETRNWLEPYREYILGLAYAYDGAIIQASGMSAPRATTVRRETKTQKWLRGPVESAIVKMIQSHDPDSQEWVKKWIEGLTTMI